MHQISIRIFVLLLTVSILSACSDNDHFSNEEWLIEINTELGLEGEDYRRNLTDYGIIGTGDKIEPNGLVTDSFVLYTLVNMTGTELSELGIDLEARDSPSDYKQAIEYLGICIDYVNGLDFDDSEYIVSYEDSLAGDDLEFRDNTILCREEYEVGDLIDNDGIYYVITSVSRKGEEYLYSYRIAGYDDVFDEVHFQTSFDLNLNSIDLDEAYGSEVNADMNRLYLQQLGTFSTYRQLQRNGFEIYYSISNSSFHISISRETVDGIKLFGEFDLSNIHPSIKWDYKDKLDEAYFRVDYQTQQKIGARTVRYFDRYLDVRELSGIDAYDGLLNAFKSRKDLVETTIPILSFRAPVPECPLFFITMELQLHIYASGRIELVLSSVNRTGIEIKNSKLRVINDNERDIDFVVKASGSTTMGLNFGLSALNFRLADIEAEAGARGYLQTVIHLYDGGKVQDIESDVPTDLADYIAEDDNKLFVCGDLSLNWLLNLKFNSSDTLLGRMGFYRSYPILDEGNQILGNRYTHIENWQFVEECTYGQAGSDFSAERIIKSGDQIVLEDYSVLVRVGGNGKIGIMELPEGYDIGDIVYEAKDPSVCTIDDGNIKAVGKGATNITVSTTDGKYQASVAVLVQDNS